MDHGELHVLDCTNVSLQNEFLVMSLHHSKVSRVLRRPSRSVKGLSELFIARNVLFCLLLRSCPPGSARPLFCFLVPLQAPVGTASMSAYAASTAVAMPFVDVASLRIAVFASFEELGQTQSPVGKDGGSSGRWDVRPSLAAIRAPLSRGGGGSGKRDLGIKSTATDVIVGMSALELVDRMNRDQAQPDTQHRS